MASRATGFPGDGGPGAVARFLALGALVTRMQAQRFLTEARAKVWANARVLASARRQGEAAYHARLAELERLAAARVADFARPGEVLLRLAARGFGIALSPGP